MTNPTSPRLAARAPTGFRWMPTRKWFAARVTAIAGLLILVVNTGSFGSSEWIALITLVSEAVVAWLVPNQSTPTGDGVPS